MRIRSGAVIVCVIVTAAAVAIVLGNALRGTRAPRSVVLVTIDTLRADRLGAYGNTDRLTPHLDSLAARGVAFTRCWTTAPLTVPAHASLLTNLVPPVHGLRTNAPSGILPPAAARPYPTLAETFLAHDYRTAAFVSASVLRKERTGLDAGFELYDQVAAAAPGALFESERRAADTVSAALDWIRGVDGQFFVWVHLFDPHAPYDAPPPWGAGPGHVANEAGYDGEVRYADHVFGDLVAGLAAAGHGDAVIAVVADHGEGLGAHGERTHGYLLHEDTLRVPLVIAAPGLLAENMRRDDTVSITDVAPTLIALAGHPVPNAMDSRALFAGGDLPERPPYAETLYGHESCGWAQMFALRSDDDHKVIDAGPRVLDIDLAADPTEDAPRSVPFVAPDVPPVVPSDVSDEAEAIVHFGLRPVAEHAPIAAPVAGPTGLEGGSYWSGSDGGGATVLSRPENARRPSPYDRMNIVALLDDGRALLTSGDPAGALALFEEALAKDPGNPQAARFAGRALGVLDRHVEAAARYRHAFELGWRHADCVKKALQHSAAAATAPGGDRDEAQRGLDFVAVARGKGVPDTAWSHVFQAVLYLALERRDEAESALEAARREPLTDPLRAAIGQVEAALR